MSKALRISHSLILLLFLLNVASAAEQTVTLTDFDDTRSGFGFAAKKVIEVKEGPVTTKTDLILDLPHGLAANNSKLTKEFQGKGGILDLGKKPLSEIKRAPESGYKPALKPDELLEGHSYCVLTADGKHYGKFHIKRIDEKRRLLEIVWQYQPKMDNEFD